MTNIQIRKWSSLLLTTARSVGSRSRRAIPSTARTLFAKSSRLKVKLMDQLTEMVLALCYDLELVLSVTEVCS